ncbi:MAG: TIGR03619 family F420-dependent LLM class oxidoreductase [Myxococcota bacterium]
MKLGISLRLMGPASQPDVVLACARAADRSPIDELWVPDHIAIPPDDALGSGGRYLDPLASLAVLAGCTERIGIGTGVLILPYRPPLPTAKWVATIQELSGGRLRLGVGVGWMQAEFRALGLERRHRGALTDRTLDTLLRCFDAEDDVVEENGQAFYFRPRPPRPPIFVGGAAPHALERAVRYGDGWMPMGAEPEALAPDVRRLHELADEARKPSPEVVAFGGLPAGDPRRSADQLARLWELGVTRFATGSRYETADEFRRGLDELAAVKEALDPSLQ